MSTHFVEESVFDAARHLADPAERRAYLDRACHDNHDLRARIELLLSAHGEGEFLELPASKLVATAEWPAIREEPGSTIGPYKLLEQIGEGGMGLVFMAEQAQPLRRRVALKIVKPGLDTKAVIARFEAERQALALMDHPNIARVYDAGTTETGRPYFVMELVRGVPITDYCRGRDIDLHERLELFIVVCQAVQHAHQKGVIHRDLKPTNILVAQSDTAPVPKVIDFGVAKAISQPLTDRTLFTHFAQIIGTPLYMSPEQADLGNQDIDTRSDVYSLGVVLYELLTGTTPFDAERLRSAGAVEMRRIIREEEPPRPSTRATTEAAALSTVAAKPQPSRILDVSSLTGDLDWIVMKALEKDRRRRYESPNALAADLVRHINHEPVDAFPPTRRYRVLKFVRRNRAALLTATALVAALAVGLGASLWQAVRATNAESAKGEALQQARRAVDDMYRKVAEEWLAEQGSLTEVQRELLESALAFYQSFSEEAGTDPEVQYAAVRALTRVGAILHRLEDNEAAQTTFLLAVDRSTYLSKQHPARHDFPVERIAARASLSAIFRKTGRVEEANKQSAQAFTEVAAIEIGNFGDASLRQRFATTLGSLGSELTFAGRKDDGQVTTKRNLEAWQSLVDEFPDKFDYRRGLAYAYLQLGQSQMWWGSTDGKAEVSLREADARLTKLLEERPRDPQCRRRLVGAVLQLGMVLGWKDRKDEALELNRRSLPLAEKLAEEFPKDPDIQSIHATSLGNLAQSLKDTKRGQPGEYDGLILRRHAVFERLVDRHPDEIQRAGLYLDSLIHLAVHLRSQGKLDEGIGLLQRASDRLTLIAERHGANRRIASEVARCLSFKAAQLIEQGNHRGAAQRLAAYPPAICKFLEDDFVVPDHAADQLGAYKIDSYLTQCSVLFTPVELLNDCVDLARADASLASDECATLVGQYTAQANQFRQEADRALDAWIVALDPHGKESGFGVAFHGELRVASWFEARQGGEAVPKHLREAYRRIDRMMLHRLANEAATGLSDEPAQHWVASMLSAAPEELRDPELALRMARRAAELAPEDTSVQETLGSALYRTGQWEECLEALKASKPGGNDPQSVRTMALWKLGRHQDARDLFKNADKRVSAFEARTKDREKRGIVVLPSVSMVKRLHEEAEALLGHPPAEGAPDSGR